MTPSQHKLLAYLKDYITRNDGVAPTFDEMKDAVGLKSKSNIHVLLTCLAERGYIRRLPHRVRAIEVLKTAAGCCPTCGRAL